MARKSTQRHADDATAARRPQGNNSLASVTQTRPKPARRLLRLREAALYIGMSVWKLRQIIQAGEIPVVQYGPNSPWLVDQSDLDRWVERHKQIL